MSFKLGFQKYAQNDFSILENDFLDLNVITLKFNFEAYKFINKLFQTLISTRHKNLLWKTLILQINLTDRLTNLSGKTKASIKDSIYKFVP